VSLRSISLVTALSFGQLVVLFVLQVVLARYFGASRELDAFMAAQSIPLVLSAVLTGSLGHVLVPLYNEQRELHGAWAAEAMLARVGWIVFGATGALALVSLALADPLVRLMYSEFPSEQQGLTAALLRLLCWLTPINATITFFYGSYHCRQWFLFPAWCGVLAPVATVLTIWAFPQLGIWRVAWGMILGGVIGVVLLAWRFPLRISSQGTEAPPILGRVGRLLLPLVLGAAYLRLDPLIDRHLASYLSDGSISHLSYASRLATSLSTIASSGLAVVAFPAIARYAAAGDHKNMALELAHGWRFLCVVLTPLFGAMLAYHEPIVRDLLQRGAFTTTDTQAVARLLVLYIGFMGAAGVGELAARAYYALGDVRTPTWIGAAAFTLGTAAKFEFTSSWHASALAGMTSAYYLLSATCLLIGLRMRLPGPLFQGLTFCFARALVATLSAVAASWPVAQSTIPLATFLGAAVGFVVYILILYIFRDEFARKTLSGVGATVRKSAANATNVIRRS
jgi:putative peptidoglycan lipid II flippase